MNCENCFSEHDGSYASGRFCCSKCAKSFSAKVNREATTKKTSETLKKQWSDRSSDLTRIRLEGLKKGRDNGTSALGGKAPKKSRSERKNFKVKTYLSWLSGESKPIISNPRFRISWFKKWLLNSGIKTNGCEKPGCPVANGSWMGLKITVQLHHKDGDPSNCKLENLEMLCPNCHASTDTYMVGARRRRDTASAI